MIIADPTPAAADSRPAIVPAGTMLPRGASMLRIRSDAPTRMDRSQPGPCRFRRPASATVAGFFGRSERGLRPGARCARQPALATSARLKTPSGEVCWPEWQGWALRRRHRVLEERDGPKNESPARPGRRIRMVGVAVTLSLDARQSWRLGPTRERIVRLACLQPQTCLHLPARPGQRALNPTARRCPPRAGSRTTAGEMRRRCRRRSS